MEPQPATLTAFAQSLGGIPGSLLLLVFFVAVFLAAFMLLRRLLGASGDFQMRFEVRSGPRPGSPPAVAFDTARPTRPEDETADTLASMGDGVASVYVSLLSFAMILVTAAAVFLYFTYPDDGNRPFMLFYGGALYVLAMLVLSARIARTRRRMQVRSILPDLVSQLRPPVQVHVQHSPQIHMIDDRALDEAARVLDAGGTIEDACRRMHPAYAGLEPHVKDMMHMAVRASLDKRREAGR